MNLVNIIVVVFGILFSKEFIAANEERIIVTSLVLVLVLGLTFLSETVKESLDSDIDLIYNDIKQYMVIYGQILRGFERFTIQRNNFLNLFHAGIVLALMNLRVLYKEWVFFADNYKIILEYYILINRTQ